ncbi:MAG: UbiA family prenyltransferase [Candidatus Omnitrophica bacterium]|nr:UbiA family prenyltransferase [Candidatus Omnitrophota bacterium]
MPILSQTTKALWEIARPRHWVKNGFVFAPLIFAKEFSNPVAVERTLLAFFFFCFYSSCIYMINDIADIDRDRLHPKKRNRPLPSGRLSIRTVQLACAGLFLFTTAGSLMLSWKFTAIGLIYATIHILYSFGGKSIVVLDGMMVASGFVLRTYAGALVIGVNFSDWLYICALFVSLFLAFSKRRHEIILLGEEDAGHHRQILQEYSTQLLDQIISIVTAATLVTYSLYCIDSTPPAQRPSPSPSPAAGGQLSIPALTPSSAPAAGDSKASKYNPLMKYTIPFVIYGVFRYLYLVYRREEGGNPTELLLSDHPLLINGLLWLSVVFWALYFGE